MKNKNNLLLLSLITLSFAACQKDHDTYPGSRDSQNGSSQKGISLSNSDGAIGAVPASFTQKVLFENITGAAYGKCPDNDYRISTAQAQYPNRIACASFHLGDGMYTQATTDILTLTNGGFIPNAPMLSMNRMLITGKTYNDPDTWSSNISTPLGTIPNCGLAIQSTTYPYQASVSIHAGFKTTISGNLKLCAYLVENNVTGTGSGYDQMNDYNTVPSSPFYNMGNPIINYNHNNVVRQVLTPMDGFPIPSQYLVPGGHFVKSIIFDVPPSIKMIDAYVIAFVYNTSNMNVLNVQTTKLGTVKSWD